MIIISIQRINKRKMFKKRHTSKQRPSQRPITTQQPYRNINSWVKKPSDDSIYQASQKENKFGGVESPIIFYDLAKTTASLQDKYHSAVSTPSTKIFKHLQRQKYIDMKLRLTKSLKKVPQKGTMFQLLQSRQQIYTTAMNELSNELQFQCKQKADILKFVWNAMLGVIEQIWSKQVTRYNQIQKQEISNGLNTHLSYQQLIQSFKQQQEGMKQRSRLEKTAINKLVYQLRFKRKELKRNERNQKLLLKTINQLKHQNLDLQNKYIDLLSQNKDMSRQQAKNFVQMRQAILQNKQTRIKLKGTKKQNILQIQNELQNEDPIQIENLYQQLKDIANNQLNSPVLASILISAAIQSFSIRNQQKNQQPKLEAVKIKIDSMDAATQISYGEFKDPYQNSQKTQVDYYDFIRHQMSKNVSCQTFCDYKKNKKTFNTQAIQVNQQYFRKQYVVKNFKIQKIYSFILCYRNDNVPAIQIQQMEKSGLHKKNYSAGNQTTLLFAVNQKDKSQQKSISSNDNKESKADIQTLKQKRMSIMKKGNRSSVVKKARYSNVRASLRSNSSSFLLKKQQQLTKKSNFTTQAQSRKHSTLKHEETQFLRPPITQEPYNIKQEVKQQIKSIKQQSNNIRYRKGRESKTSFIPDKSNQFTINIDQNKSNFIDQLFNRAIVVQTVEESSNTTAKADQSNSSNDQMPTSTAIKTLKSIKKQVKKKSCQFSIPKIIPTDIVKQTQKNKDIYRSSSKTKSHSPKAKSQLKYQNQFVILKQSIATLAKDVQDLIQHRQAYIRSSFNRTNMKGVYKIIMTTFSKVYDYLAKGIVLGNLLYPLFQAFSLIYGTINHHQIYRKIVAFIAGITLNTQNVILRFFLFLLGLDSSSPYSPHITISQVYLSMKLFQNISLNGKVTINIESVCTDVEKVKQQLFFILREENIPQSLSLQIQRKVIQQLQKSLEYCEQMKGQKTSELKVNIFSIIMLITQQIIQGKMQLKQSLLPFLSIYSSTEVPIQILYCFVDMWKINSKEKRKLKSIIRNYEKQKIKMLSYQQICSALFQSNIVRFQQLYQQLSFNITPLLPITSQFLTFVEEKIQNERFQSAQQKFQIKFFDRLSKAQIVRSEDIAIVFKMKQLLFENCYDRQVDKLMPQGLILIKSL